MSLFLRYKDLAQIYVYLTNEIVVQVETFYCIFNYNLKDLKVQIVRWLAGWAQLLIAILDSMTNTVSNHHLCERAVQSFRKNKIGSKEYIHLKEKSLKYRISQSAP